jgi:hypothetical protein
MRVVWLCFTWIALAPWALAQTVCPSTPIFSTCEITFELSGPDATAHPAPYRDVDLRVEFRSPRARTFAVPGFWDGGSTLRVRFMPNETGKWIGRVISNVAAWNDKELTFAATDSSAPGFVETANVHHFANSGPFAYNSLKSPHLWMGQTIPNLSAMSRDQVAQLAATRAKQKFNHFRVTLLEPEVTKAFKGPEDFDPAPFREIDQKLLAANKQGIAIDLSLAGPDNTLTRLFPQPAQRRRFVQYAVARYGGMNMTWQGVDRFETYTNGRELMKEIGAYLNELDAYHHPTSCGAAITSSPLFDDHVTTYITYHSDDPQVGAVEHQIYASPQVNDFGGGLTSSDTAAFRKRLWNAWMSGQYPEATLPNEEAARAMEVWNQFAAGTRHWDLEPFFDVDGGRGMCLPTVEYIIYVEKPGPVDVRLDDKHKWDVAWVNPINGERTELKDFKSEEFQGSPPDNSHDWVLHISREGHKAGMLKSYKFESWEIVMQEVEVGPDKVPFDIEKPAEDTFSLNVQPPYRAKLKKETKASKKMMYLWTGEVSADGQGFRVIGTGPEGIFNIPSNIAMRFPAGFHLRVMGINGYGKVYQADRNYQLNR